MFIILILQQKTAVVVGSICKERGSNELFQVVKGDVGRNGNSSNVITVFDFENNGAGTIHVVLDRKKDRERCVLYLSAG